MGARRPFVGRARLRRAGRVGRIRVTRVGGKDQAKG